MWFCPTNPVRWAHPLIGDRCVGWPAHLGSTVMQSGPPPAEAPVDAVLILSFGGPERPEDVMDFLRNVTRGRNVPDERLAEVAEQYLQFGGRSPINDQCRELAAELTDRLTGTGRNLPVYFGARNWHPFVADTVRRMTDDGVRHAAVFVTSAFGSYSGCRQYREDLARAGDEVGPGAPELTKLRLFYNHPGFIDPLVDNLAAGLGRLSRCQKIRVLFSAHSIPVSMAAGCDYEDQLANAAGLILDRLEAAGHGRPEHDMVYQSRSGPPQVPWLEPDINDHLRALVAVDDAPDGVVVVPLGFTSDHMEVMFDLDTQAAQTAADIGLAFDRVPTVGTDPRYVDMIIGLVEEIAVGATPVAIGSHGPWPAVCPDGHCAAPQRPARRTD